MIMEKSTRRERILEFGAFGVLCGTMAAIPLVHYLCLRNGLHTGYIANTIYGCGALATVVLVIALALEWNRFIFSRYEILFSLLLIFQAISTVFSENRILSLYGSPSRCEGLLMLHSYYVLFFLGRLLRKRQLRASLVYFFLGLELLHCLYGLNQQYHLVNVGFDYYFYAISGLAGNPNFMATLTIMMAGLTLGLVLFSRGPGRAAAGLGLLVCLATQFLTKTFSAFIGTLAMAVCALILTGIKKPRLVPAVLAAGTAAMVGLLWLTNGLGNNYLAADLTGLFQEFPTLLLQGIKDPTVASGRPYLWYHSLQLLWEHPLTGVGIDNLQGPFYEAFGLFQGQYADKCHNELLQVLVTMGFPAFTCYLLLYVFLIRDQIKRLLSPGRDEGLEAGLFLCLVGYLVQACFNISVIDVAPYFWILCGLMAPPLLRDQEEQNSAEAVCC